MSDLLHLIDNTHRACLVDNETPRDLLIPSHLEPLMREAFGVHARFPAPINWLKYRDMNIEWTTGGTQLSIRTAKGDLRICK